MKSSTVAKIGGLMFCLMGNISLHAQDDHFDRIQKVVASDRQMQDFFGSSVAILGDNAIVGVPQNDTDENNANPIDGAGAIYIYTRNAEGIWNQVQKLVAPVRNTNDRFGTSVAITQGYAIVGAPNEDEDQNETNTLNNAGAVYFLIQDVGGNWSVHQKRVATDRAISNYYGSSVSIDYTNALVGAYGNGTDINNVNPLSYAGAAYFIHRDGSNNWAQSQKLVAPIRNLNDQFGTNVSLSSSFMIIGAPAYDLDENGTNALTDAGAAFVFEIDGLNNVSLLQTIAEPTRDPGNLFGRYVDINGSKLVIGSPFESHDLTESNYIQNSGALYIYRLLVSPSLAFYLESKVVADDRMTDAFLGTNVRIFGYHVISSSMNNTDENGQNTLSNAGSAYIFKYTTSWGQHKKMVSPIRTDSDFFGYSVGVSFTGSGMSAMISSYAEDEDENESNQVDNAGAVYFYTECTNTAATFTETACNNIYWLGNYYDASGTYIDTIPNAIGCDSVVTLNLSIYFTDTTVTYAGGELSSNHGNAQQYQWINCTTNQPIAGETNQEFVPTVNGTYAVIISTVGGCSDTSECVVVNSVGISEAPYNWSTVSPNPTSNIVSITGELAIDQCIVRDFTGKILPIEVKQIPNNEIQLNLSELPDGIYLIQILSKEGESSTLRVIKQ